MDRLSEFTPDECEGIATEAAKRVVKLGLGGEVLQRAYGAETPQQLAVVLGDCLALLPQESEPPSDLLTVEQAAVRLGNVSPSTVSREIEDGNLRCVRVRGSVRVPVDAITDYIECQQQ